MYSVDYATLQSILQQFGYTGVFRAKVGASRYQKEAGFVELHVTAGVVQACFFISGQKQIYKWEEWEQKLARLGVLDWEQASLHFVDPLPPPPNRSPASAPFSPPPPSQLPPPRQATANIPYQVALLSPAQLLSLPMPYRRVYALIDGRRRIIDIAAMLRRPEAEIAHIMNDLRMQNLIQFR